MRCYRALLRCLKKNLALLDYSGWRKATRNLQASTRKENIMLRKRCGLVVIEWQRNDEVLRQSEWWKYGVVGKMMVDKLGEGVAEWVHRLPKGGRMVMSSPLVSIRLVVSPWRVCGFLALKDVFMNGQVLFRQA
ncbi:hypothetical protein V6N13_007812 [Hibiscus sabdariffa]